ncbi:conserved hypothetical protein [Pyrenophora tritici-repentis Pt-1C-BFP]|uniref:Transcription factor domain-containing protein n=1 Tax=Pyrenophora tritici-repentis (strain Pt-1C-BFP) TaxID=426418 RepID=B2VWU4_PYRTR|nr:uncharacterized protein PTRG_01656 [Pyrenophora tritici-repentis Pt-1C-BFP]EDU41094.1 conserved hypothetical protein [Pyrenophora tritici-repentis Pt-1C-BFP]
MTTSPLRPLPQLLPAPPGACRRPTTQPKKPQVSAACNNCRAQSRQVKREYEEMRGKRSAHEKLFDMLRTMSETDSADVLRRIRAGGNVQDILNQINDGNLLMQLSLFPERRRGYELPYRVEIPAFIRTGNNLYLESVVYENASTTSEPVPLADVKESAMNIYMMPYSSAVMADPLLSRVTTAKWTNVIINNTLLRQLLGAYFMYQHPSYVYLHKDLFLQDMLMPYSRPAAIVQAIHDSTQFWNPHTLGYLFLAETKRLWELEVSESLSLTTVEAALILQIVMNENGLDRVGLSYMLQALLIAKEIDLFQKPKWSANEELTKARAVTAWRFFNWQSMYCYYFFRTSFLDRPPNIALPDPMKYPEWYGEFWLRYPNSQILESIHLGCEFGARSALRVFIMDMSIALYGTPERKAILTLDQILGFYFRLDAWFTSLPDSLRPQKVVYPTQLELHFEVHNTFSVWIQVFVGNLAVEALKYARIDGSGDSTMIDVHRSTLVLCALGLHSQGLSYQLGKLSFRALQVCMAPEDLQLVRTYCTPGEEAEQSLLLQHTQSLWPLPITNINDNPDTALLNGFLREYQDLDLDTDGKSRSSNVSGGM